MQIADDVLRVLSNVEIEGPFVRIAEQLDRKLYVNVNKVLEACGGEWDRRAKAHVFDGDARARIEHAIVTGEVATDQDLGFFPTPDDLARALVTIAEVKPGHVVLEPSAGEGAIVDWIQCAGANVIAIERDHRRRDLLLGKVISIHDWTCAVHVVRNCDDFLDFEPDEPVDRVVMNPPFCRVGQGDHLDHVRHAFEMLDSGGVLVSVLPAGMKFRTDKRHTEFRAWASTIGNQAVREFTWTDLPDDSFKSSGTSVRTGVLRMVRR